jgi:hypothetical protein
MTYTDAELIALIETQLYQAEGSDYSDDELAQSRELAWDYYFGRDNGAVPALSILENSSSVKHLVVHDYVNAVIAQMVPSLTGDQPCTFEPDGPGDEQQADMESAAINKLLMEDNRGFQLCYAAAKDAALFKNCWAKVYCTDREEVEVRKFAGIDEEQAALLASDEVEVKRDGRSGDTVVKAKRKVKELKVSIVEPANICYTRNWDSTDMQDCPFVAERCIYTRADLIQMGYSKDKVMALKPYTVALYGQNIAKNVGQNNDYQQGITKEQDRVEVWECYVRMDDNELWQVIWGDRQVLSKEPVQLVPYCTGVLYLTPHRCSGESLFDKLRPLQDTATSIARDLVDNLKTCNHQRLIVNGEANRDDLADSGPGRHVRTEGDVRASVGIIPIQDTTSGALAGLDYIERLASKRAGAALDLQTGDAQLIDKQIGSIPTQQLIGHQELQAATMTRVFAETFLRSLFLLMHQTLRYDYDQPLVLRKGGQWQQTIPTQWPVRTRINVKTGMSPGERNRKISALTFVLQAQSSAMQSGMPIANPQTLHATLMDYMKAADLDGGERYFIDPQSPEYQQAQQQMAQMQQQQQQMQMQLATLADQVKLQIAQLQDQTDRLKIAADLEKAEADNVTKIGTAELQARVSALSNQRSQEGGERDTGTDG